MEGTKKIFLNDPEGFYLIIVKWLNNDKLSKKLEKEVNKIHYLYENGKIKSEQEYTELLYRTLKDYLKYIIDELNEDERVKFLEELFLLHPEKEKYFVREDDKKDGSNKEYEELKKELKEIKKDIYDFSSRIQFDNGNENNEDNKRNNIEKSQFYYISVRDLSFFILGLVVAYMILSKNKK